ncbi:hypothetical protein F5Y16DRAFT_400984 [Xylariaceae sp. FL0255]|nr:hypothetical protein F5Y16DRAFT_400984 [Xylariaceae sp. FL0255]
MSNNPVYQHDHDDAGMNDFTRAARHCLSQRLRILEIQRYDAMRAIGDNPSTVPSPVDAVSASDKVIIDLTLPSGPECSICHRELDGCQTNAYSNCGCLVCETCALANQGGRCGEHEDDGLQSILGIYGLFDPCNICQGALRWLMKGENCGHVFCRQCLDLAVENGYSRCPCCRMNWDKEESPDVYNFYPIQCDEDSGLVGEEGWA